MTSMRDSIQMNRKIIIGLAFLLGLLFFFVFKFYLEQKDENRILRLKIISMSEAKKSTKSWSELTAPPVTKTVVAPLNSVSDTSSEKLKPETPSVENQDLNSLSDLTIQELAIKLDTMMKQIKDLDQKAIDETILMANEIISREPNLYSAHKAKLISLLVREGKFQEQVDDFELDKILQDLAEFKMDSDDFQLREALMIASSRNEQIDIENQLENLELQILNLEEQRNSLAPDSIEFKQTESMLSELVNKQTDLESRVSENQNDNSARLNSNQDIIEIPLMRLLAQNNLDEVIESTESLINEYPDDANAYFYLIKAKKLKGDEDQITAILQDSKLSQESQALLLNRLETEKGEEPKKYWEKLTF